MLISQFPIFGADSVWLIWVHSTLLCRCFCGFFCGVNTNLSHRNQDQIPEFLCRLLSITFCEIFKSIAIANSFSLTVQTSLKNTELLLFLFLFLCCMSLLYHQQNNCNLLNTASRSSCALASAQSREMIIQHKLNWNDSNTHTNTQTHTYNHTDTYVNAQTHLKLGWVSYLEQHGMEEISIRASFLELHPQTQMDQLH